LAARNQEVRHLVVGGTRPETLQNGKERDGIGREAEKDEAKDEAKD
jgi:hypothetical protein